MKRIISLLLGIMLLCGVLAAAAEESLPYMEMFKNDQPYKRYTLLTPDSCPAVCITPSSSFMLYDAAIPDDPLFVVFSAPPTNSLCKIFYVDRATYEDLEGDRKIEYGFRSDYWTNEKFLEKVTDPELIVLDEPLSGLDPVNTDLIRDVIRDEIAKGKYLIMSSHQMATVEEFCTDITILDRSHAVLQGNLNDIKKSYGRVHLHLKCEADAMPYIEAAGAAVISEKENEYELKVSGEEQAGGLLKTLIDAGIPIITYDLREPSLHDIFVEKVGEEHPHEV